MFRLLNAFNMKLQQEEMSGLQNPNTEFCFIEKPGVIGDTCVVDYISYLIVHMSNHLVDIVC